MHVVNVNLRAKFDTIANTPQGKDLVQVYKDRMANLVLELTRADIKLVPALQGEVQGIIFALQILTGRNVKFKIDTGD